MDNIVFSTVWRDEELIQIEAICSSALITVVSRIYTCEALLDELISCIEKFLGRKSKEALWKNGTKGDKSTPCLFLRFLKKDRCGHVVIEVFAELDDGGKYTEHNCCFFINTEQGLLLDFCKKIARLKNRPIGYTVQLHDQ